MNKFPIYGIITALLIVFRCILNNNPQLVIVVAVINLIALLIVVFDVTSKIKTGFSSRIQQTGVPDDIVTREAKRIKKRIDCIVYIPLLVVYIVYPIFWVSNLGNDVITIIALCISLSDSYIVDTIVDSYKK